MQTYKTLKFMFHSLTLFVRIVTKSAALLSLTLLAVASMAAFTFSDVLSDIGLNPEDARRRIFKAVTEEDLYDAVRIHSTKARLLAPEARGAAVKALGSFIKSYCTSDDFRQKYEAHQRNEYRLDDKGVENYASSSAKTTEMMVQLVDMKPVAECLEDVNVKIENAQLSLHDHSYNDEKEKAEITKELAELKKLQPLAKTNQVEFKKGYKEVVRREYEKMYASTAQFMEKANADDLARRTKEFEANKDANVIIRKRLQDFLTLTKNMPYDAKLVERQGKKRFADPALESKPYEWKFLFRMGRETVEPAREFAAAWLKELESK